jgi:uncharacterized protein (DUF433 family)
MPFPKLIRFDVSKKFILSQLNLGLRNNEAGLELVERVELNPKILGGKPVIKGTRIPVYLILELLSAGYSFKRIIKAYPTLTEDEVKAAVNYAAQRVKNEEAREYAVP